MRPLSVCWYQSIPSRLLSLWLHCTSTLVFSGTIFGWDGWNATQVAWSMGQQIKWNVSKKYCMTKITYLNQYFCKCRHYMAAKWEEIPSQMETSFRFGRLLQEKQLPSVSLLWKKERHSLTGRSWGVFCEGVSFNHITVHWQRRSKQPSLTGLHCECSAFPSLCFLSSAWIVFQTDPRSLGYIHTRTRWGSWTGCLLFAGTRALQPGWYHHGCS